jgi:23S rRNA pseudouridine2605 synthase
LSSSVRIHKWIASTGVTSRRKAEEVLLEGRITLNGVVVKQLGTLMDPATDVVTFDGNTIYAPSELKTYLFYKPRGIITSKSDELGRKTIMDYFEFDTALNPVGRLDQESEGLLLMTHDGDLLLKLTHPRYGVKKIYEVDVVPSGQIITPTLKNLTPLSDAVLSQLCECIELSDGPGHFDSITHIQADSILKYRIEVSEGRNRFVRRMLEAVGYSVQRLVRVQHGPYLLGNLKPGEWIAASELNLPTKTLR